MDDVSVFDVLGPIMIGPSSSHTAGAARLGKMAKTIVNKPIKKVTFLLHGSFRETYKGHGTDRALVAGILGMDPDDPQLKNSMSIAHDKGLIIEFLPADLGQVHPNTVKFLITDCDDTPWDVMGSSIGGGLIEITEINGHKVQITGKYPTIIVCHNDIPGTVSKISTIIYQSDLNIAFMTLTRSQKGKNANTTIEVDGKINDSIINQIQSVEGVTNVIVINSLGGN